MFSINYIKMFLLSKTGESFEIEVLPSFHQNVFLSSVDLNDKLFVNCFYFLDFDQDGIADNISFMIKRIKVHTSEAAKDPHYRFPGNYGVEKFLELFSGKYHHVMFKYFSVEKFLDLFPGKYCSVMFKKYFS